MKLKNWFEGNLLATGIAVIIICSIEVQITLSMSEIMNKAITAGVSEGSVVWKHISKQVDRNAFSNKTCEIKYYLEVSDKSQQMSVKI